MADVEGAPVVAPRRQHTPPLDENAHGRSDQKPDEVQHGRNVTLDPLESRGEPISRNIERPLTRGARLGTLSGHRRNDQAQLRAYPVSRRVRGLPAAAARDGRSDRFLTAWRMFVVFR